MTNREDPIEILESIKTDLYDSGVDENNIIFGRDIKAINFAIKVLKERSLGYGKFAEKLKDRIKENVCKHCPMNKNCVLCEVSRVFQIITLTIEEQKGDMK